VVEQKGSIVVIVVSNRVVAREVSTSTIHQRMLLSSICGGHQSQGILATKRTQAGPPDEHLIGIFRFEIVSFE
jgi:hypothetical protein